MIFPLLDTLVSRLTTSLTCCDFWWFSMLTTIKDYVRSCDSCCLSKDFKHKPYGLLQPFDIPNYPCNSISIDFITDLPISNGFTCVLVILDRFSKMGHFILLPNVLSAVDTAKSFMNTIFRLHGLTNEILSDRGTQFTSKL